MSRYDATESKHGEDKYLLLGVSHGNLLRRLILTGPECDDLRHETLEVLEELYNGMEVTNGMEKVVRSADQFVSTNGANTDFRAWFTWFKKTMNSEQIAQDPNELRTMEKQVLLLLYVFDPITQQFIDFCVYGASTSKSLLDHLGNQVDDIRDVLQATVSKIVCGIEDCISPTGIQKALLGELTSLMGCLHPLLCKGQ